MYRIQKKYAQFLLQILLFHGTIVGLQIARPVCVRFTVVYCAKSRLPHELKRIMADGGDVQTVINTRPPPHFVSDELALTETLLSTI